MSIKEQQPPVSRRASTNLSSTPTQAIYWLESQATNPRQFYIPEAQSGADLSLIRSDSSVVSSGPMEWPMNPVISPTGPPVSPNPSKLLLLPKDESSTCPGSMIDWISWLKLATNPCRIAAYLAFLEGNCCSAPSFGLVFPII